MPSEEKGEGKDGGTLVDKVCEHCIETGLDQEFEQFCAKNAPIFVDAAGEAATSSTSVEHKLAYQECFDEFLASFEKRLQTVIEREGASAGDFRDACEDVLRGDEFHPRRFFVERLLAIMDYQLFFSMMVGEARLLKK